VRGDPALTSETSGETETRVCRRYEEGASPLVRDHVRGWRSGRLDRVLAGDFDLIGEPADISGSPR
jgi:ATP-dependent Clp protease ATP-binding subunit ClpC